jgi:hypothetical protein
MGNSLALSSLVLSIAIGGIALSLGLHQWSEWRWRDADLANAERVYFFRQDLRRAVGVVFMLMIALGIFVGSRLPPILADFPYDADLKQVIRVNVHANPQFLLVWLVVIVLLAILLALALSDWLATRRFAHRQRQSMARERLEILRETFRRPDTDRNGHPMEPGLNGS